MVSVSRTVTVGLIADAGLPEQVAGHLAEDLGRDLAEEVDGSADWHIEVSRETLPLTDTGQIPLAQHAPRLLKAHDWDAVVYLTDLPRRHDVCLPALGAWRVTARTRALLVPLLASLASRSDDAAAAARAVNGTTTEHASPGDVPYLIRPGQMNRLRLLAGMVRNNRPGGLLPALSSTAQQVSAPERSASSTPASGQWPTHCRRPGWH